MAIRTREQLDQDQAALLAEYRAGLSADSSAPSAGEAEAVALIGKVTSVVTSDPTYGAHLVVQSQAFVGTPPVAAAAAKPTVRVYATPNRAVTDYAVGEFVHLLTCRGAVLAAKMG